MKLIVGLGNPGERYKNNRHNTGFLVVDELRIDPPAGRAGNGELRIFKSQNTMNDSGSFVQKKLKAYGLQTTDLYIIHDDLDIKLGEYKIQFGKGPKDHNGILDIEEKLGTKNFWRIRVGIENRLPENKISGEIYTLQDFTDEERIILNKTIKELCKKLETTLTNLN